MSSTEHEKMGHCAVLWLVAAGTVCRFIYGQISQAWLLAPDQLAWELGLSDMLLSGKWSFAQLMHAPQEGGGWLLSLLSLPFRRLGVVMPPLSFAALIVDTLSRFLQITIAGRVAGRRIAWWFGGWTVLAVPSILPWGVVNYGLHSLFSWIPFVFLVVFLRLYQRTWAPVAMGVLSGAALSLVYDSIVLVPVCLAVIVAFRPLTRASDTLVYLAALLICLIPHALLQLMFCRPDGAVPFAIRGMAWQQWLSLPGPLGFISAWLLVLPAAFMWSEWLPAIAACAVALGFLTAGIIRFYASAKENIVRFSALLTVVSFVTIYACSPFFGRDFRNTSYVYYRHISFILPFISFVVITGLSHPSPYAGRLVCGWVMCCGLSTLHQFWSVNPAKQAAYRPAGWIIVHKMSDVPALLRIASLLPFSQRIELLRGYGWGMAAMKLSAAYEPSSVQSLQHIISRFPPADRLWVNDGVQYAFSPGVTPVLERSFLPLIKHHQLPGK